MGSAFNTAARSAGKPGVGTGLGDGRGPLHWAWTGPSGVNVAGCSERRLRSSGGSRRFCNGQKLPAVAGRVVTRDARRFSRAVALEDALADTVEHHGHDRVVLL